MLSSVSLPAWAWGYLCLVTILCVASVMTKTHRRPDAHLCSAFSYLTIMVFVVSFYNADIARFFGLWLVPMAIIGAMWEFKKALLETKRAQRELQLEPELSEGERDVLLNLAIGFNAIVVVPAYVMGLVLSYHMIMALIGGGGA